MAGNEDDTEDAHQSSHSWNYQKRIEDDSSMALSVAGLLFFLAGFLGAGGIFALKVLSWLKTAEMPQWTLSQFVPHPAQTDWAGVNVSLDWLWSQETELLVLAVGVIAGFACVGLSRRSS